MRMQQTPTWISRACGVIAVATGVACLHGVSLLPGLRDWAATDLLHGWFAVLVTGVAIVLVVAAPFRSGFGLVPLGLGLLCGGALWWLWFALSQAQTDLRSRNDQYFAVLAAMILAVFLGKAVVGPLLMRLLARRELRREPRANGLLRWARAIMLGPDRGHLCRGGHRWWHWLFQTYNWARCSLRIGPSRSCAIERAIEKGIDRESRRLRSLLDKEAAGQHLVSPTMDDQAYRAADAGAAYLELVAILDESALGSQVGETIWMRRFLAVWDLIRFAEQIEQKELGRARAELLLGVERLSSRTPILSEAVRAARCENPRLALIDRVSEKVTGKANLSEQLAAVLLADLLVDLEHATWALGLLDEVLLGEVVGWMRPTLERIRLQAEQQILRHEVSLEESDKFARLAQCERAAVIADAPQRSRASADVLLSWREVTVMPVRRGTLGLPAIARPRFDPGPGRGLATAALVAIGIFTAIAVTSKSPLGQAYKPLADLHRPIDYHEHPLTSVALNPKDDSLLVTSLGGGLHHVDTRTFRIRTETPDNGGPSTKFLTDVAVSKLDQIAVVTAQDARATFSGLDVRGPNGWQRLIAPSGVSGLSAKDISFVGAIGADKVLLAGSRVLRYRTAQRELTELAHDNQGPPINGLILAATSSPTDAQKLWVAAGQQDQPSHVIEIFLRDDGRYSTQDITGEALAAETVKHLATGTDRLWASTETGRLYQHEGKRWSLRIDGDTGLDLGAVRHVIVGAGDPPALWLTDRAASGAVRTIRARILSNQGILPDGPWRRIELGLAGVPRSADLRLGASDGTPAAWFDAARQEHVLAVPGRDGGLWCFRASLELPETFERAMLSAEQIPTPGERIWSIDQHGQKLVCVLETLDGTRRRVAVQALDVLWNGLDMAEVVQQSAMPEEAVFRGAQFLSFRHQQAERRLDLFTDGGRVLTYDLNRHGLTTSSGTRLVRQSGVPVGRLRSVDSDNGKMIAVAEQGRIVEAELPTRVDAKDTLAVTVLFEPSNIAPPVSFEPVRVATEPDGIDLLMAESGSPVGMPWRLRTSTSQVRANEPGRQKQSLVEWVPLPVEKPLQIGSLTRVQDGARIGPQIAIDQSSQLLWRDTTGWKKAEKALKNSSEILPAVGATFVRDTEGMKRIGLTDQGPMIGTTLWTTPPPILRLPITAIAAIRGANPQKSPVCIVVGHASGLAQYDLESRNWRALANAAEAKWTFLGAENERGVCEHLWALKTDQDKTVSQVILVKGDQANVFADSPIAEARGTGDSLGLLFADGRLALATPGRVVKTLIHEKAPAVGDATLKRLALAERLYALDANGRLLSASQNTLEWQLEQQPDGGPFRDLETTANGSLLLISNDGRVLRLARPRPVPMGVNAQQLQQLVTDVAATDLKNGRLEILNRQGQLMGTAAGGRDATAQIGDRALATLTDGDDLFIAGPSGAVWRDPNQRRSVPIPNGDVIDRFEKLGPHRIVWKKTQPFLLTDGNAPKLIPLGDPGTDVVLAPDSTLWLSETKSGVTRLKPVNGADSGLFESESLLGDKLTQAAPLSDGQIVLQGKSGELLLYEAAKRRIRLLAKANALPSDWRFALVSKQVFIIPSSANRQGPIHRIDSNPLALRLLEKSASHVLEFSNGLAWLDDSGSLRHIDAQGKDQILVRLPFRLPTTDAALQVTQILAGADDSLWVLVGSTAFEYRVKEGGIGQRVSNVLELVRVGTQVAAIRKAPNTPKQLIALGPKLNLLALAFGEARGGTDSVLTWGIANETLSIEHLTEKPKTYRKSITPFSRLSSDTANRIAAADDRMLYCRTDQGALLAYDVMEGGWATLPKAGPGWDAVGQMREFVIAMRRMGMTSDVMALKANGERQGLWEVPGTAWFMDDGFARLIRNANNAVQIVKQRFDGSTELLRQFDRASAPFTPERSFVIESKDLKAALVCTSVENGQEIFLVRANQTVTHLKEIKFPPLFAQVPVFYQGGEFLFLDAKNCLVQINAVTGGTKVGTAELEGLGVIGKKAVEVVTVRKTESKGLTFSRLRDGKDIISLLSKDDHAQYAGVTKFQFVTDRTNRHLLQLKLGDGVLQQPDAPNTESDILSLEYDTAIVEQIAATALKKQTTSLQIKYGSKRVLLVLGRSLEQDGWFSDQYVLRFAAKSTNRGTTNAVPLEMRDGQQAPVAVDGNVSTTPPEGFGGFSLDKDELRSKDSRIRFGRLIRGGRTTFACDVWADALPFGKDEFVTLDSFGQLWRWTDSNGTLTRRFIELPSAIRDSRPKQLSLAAEDTDGLVLLDDKNTPIARISPEGKMIPDKDVVPVSSPGQRSGQSGPVGWVRATETMTGKSSLVLSLSVRDGESKSVMPIRMTDSGLDADAPVGLKAIDGEKLPWLHLGRAAEGREVVCPPIAAARLQQARTVGKFAAIQKPAEFRSGSFHFVPRDDGWGVQIAGNRIELAAGRLAVDSVLDAATVSSGDGTDLFLATAQPRVLVRQRWGRDLSLGMPELLATPGEIRSLRTWGSELVLQTADNKWHLLRDGQWAPSAPEWQAVAGGPSRWKFTSDNKVLHWNDQPISLLTGKAGFALASDVLAETPESDGAPRVRQGLKGEIVFSSASGDWLSWAQGQIVAVPTADVPPQASTEIELPDARIRVPKRAGDEGVYKLRFGADSSATLPMKLVDGRLPHHQVETLSSWDKDGLQAQLGSKHGSWCFDRQSLQAGNSPQFSTKPVASPNAPPNYDRHVAVELRKNQWLRWTPQDRTWQLEFAASKSATAADAVLGSLTETGIPIDNPAEVRPLELRDGRIRFAFRGQLWSRSLANLLADFANDGELPFGPKTALGVDPGTGRFTLRAQDVTPSLVDPALGVFSPDGQYDAAASAVASTQRTDTTFALRLHQRGPAPLDIELIRDRAQWKTPFDNPRGVLDRGQRLLVLNDEGTSLGVWDRTGGLLGLVSTPAPITSMWRQGQRVLARQALNNEVSVVELREEGNGLPKVVPVELPDNEIVVTTDSFAMRRSLSDGHFDVVWRAQGQDDWQVLNSWPSTGFPGSRVDAALWLSDDALACQDGLGVRRLDLMQRAYSPLHRPLNNADPPSLIRHAGQLMYGPANSQLVVREERNPEGLRFIPPSEEIGLQSIAEWQVRQSGRDRPVSLQATDANDRHILLGDANSTGPKTGGALLVDRVQLLANLKTHPALVLSAGVQWLDRQGAFLEADDEVRSVLASGNLRVLSSPNLEFVLVSKQVNDKAIHLDQSLRVGPLASDAAESIYAAADDDWRLFRNAEHELVLERPVAAVHGRQVDRIKGEDIFSVGGQFSFDRVLSVTHDSDGGGTLLISTERAVEAVRFTSAGPALEVHQLGKAEIPPPTDRAALSVSWEDGAEINLKRGDQFLHLSVPLKREQAGEAAHSKWSLPRAFETGRRAWVVEPSGIYWIETDDRWSDRRRDLEASSLEDSSQESKSGAQAEPSDESSLMSSATVLETTKTKNPRSTTPTSRREPENTFSSRTEPTTPVSAQKPPGEPPLTQPAKEKMKPASEDRQGGNGNSKIFDTKDSQKPNPTVQPKRSEGSSAMPSKKDSQGSKTEPPNPTKLSSKKESYEVDVPKTGRLKPFPANQQHEVPSSAKPTKEGLELAKEYRKRGNEEFGVNNFKEAVRQFSSAVLLDGSEASYGDLAVAHLYAGNYRDAVEDTTKVIAMNPKNAAAFYLRGLCYRRLNKLPEADSDISRALELEPTIAQRRRQWETK